MHSDLEKKLQILVVREMFLRLMHMKYTSWNKV